MSDDEIRESIARACGFSDIATEHYGILQIGPVGSLNGSMRTPLPYYATDLQAIHEAEALLCDSNYMRETYAAHLCNSVGSSFMCQDGMFEFVHATARQRALALLSAIEETKR